MCNKVWEPLPGYIAFWSPACIAEVSVWEESQEARLTGDKDAAEEEE